MINKLPLTAKEEEILAYIYGYIDDNLYSPTRKEIADKFKMTTQAAHYFIGKLIEKDKLKLSTGKWRNIKLK